MTLRPCTLLTLLALTATPFASAPLRAQAPASAVLPEAPSVTATGAVHGTLLYPNGSPVSQADLTLTPASGPALHATTDPDGTWIFVAVPPGLFRLDASSDDATPASTTGTLAPAASLELPTLTLRFATVVTSVNAISQEELAEQQVQAEEHQRLFGAIPNFFVSYDTRAVPLTAGQKFRLSTRTLVDPATIALAGVVAGGEQTVRMYPGFARGPKGFAERFAASLGDSTSQMMLTGAILPSLFRQDPRYFYQGTGSNRSRLVNVLRQAVTQRGDNGHWQFAWSNTLGDIGSAVISDSYYPRPAGQSRQWGTLTGTNFGLSIGSQAFANFLQEFVFHRLTTHPPE